MPKVSDEHREQRRSQILDAALACFAERGFVATSMADVIDASGLSAGAIYSYFGGKDELALAVARRFLGGRVAELDRLGAGAELVAPSGLIRSFVASLQQEGLPLGLIVQMWGEAVTTDGFALVATEALGGVRASMAAALARWAREARGAGREAADAWARRAAPALLALAQGYIIQSVLMPGFDAEAFLDGVDALVAAAPTAAEG